MHTFWKKTKKKAKKKPKAELKKFPKKVVETTNTEHCLMCGEFDKDKVLWMICLVCEQWAYTKNTDGQSGYLGYICDECQS